jgi:hypothetical protein
VAGNEGELQRILDRAGIATPPAQLALPDAVEVLVLIAQQAP